MPLRLLRFLAYLTSFSLIAPLARAQDQAPLPEPPVIRAARAVTQAPVPRPAPPEPEPWERDDTLAHVSFAISGVGFLTAAASVLLKKRLASNDDCRTSGKCQPRSREEITRDKALGQATAIGTLVGVAGGVTGLVLLLLAKRQKRNKQGVSAVVEPSYAGLKARF
jgi:hypothetical protein